MQPVSRVWSRPRRRFTALLLVTLSLYVLGPKATMVRSSFGILRHSQLRDLCMAVWALAITFPLAASTYHFLARRRLVYGRTILVAIANMFTNRLLPAGAGSIATFFVYLRKRKHTVSQATSVVAINNCLGFVSHGTLLAILLIVDGNGFRGFTVPGFKPWLLLVGVALVICSSILVIGNAGRRRRMLRFSHSLRRDLLFYRRFPLRLGGAFITSALLTIANAVALYYCLQAVGAQLGLVATLAVFTIGMVAATVTPTPGGFGGTEAGLLAGLIGYHVPSQKALAAVIVYRLLSYWLTLAIGAVTYVYIERRGYLHRFEPLD